jgi:hypothetical protein
LKVLIIGAGEEVKTSLMMQKMREEYGEDVELYTPEEAQAQGLKPEDFGNTSCKITAPPVLETPMILGTPPSGRDKRKKRREEERRAKKHKR